MASTRQQNVASDYPEGVEKLRKSYGAWWKETVPLMVNEDRPYAAEHPQEVRYEKQLKERGIPDWVPPEWLLSGTLPTPGNPL